jgi:hypothetical protein
LRKPDQYSRVARIAAVILSVAFGVSSSACPAQRGKSSPEALTESEIKASYLLNFVRFTDWSGGANSSHRPLTICVAGKDAFTPPVLADLAKQTIAGRSLQIRILSDVQPIPHCHVLFVGDSEDERVVELIEAARSWQVLTVGETTKFRSAGGMIRFFESDGTIRFEVNADALSRSPLKLSSRLLSVAKVVGADGVPRAKY